MGDDLGDGGVRGRPSRPRECEHDPQVFGEGHVEERFELVGNAQEMAQLRHAEADPLGMVVGTRHLDGVPTEHDVTALRVGPLLAHPVAHTVVEEPLLAFLRRQREGVAEGRHLVEQERVGEREEHLELLGRRLRKDLCSILLRGLGELDGGAPRIRRVRQRLHRVDVHGFAARVAHREHQLAVVDRVPVEVRARDELDRAVRELRERARRARPVRRDRRGSTAPACRRASRACRAATS